MNSGFRIGKLFGININIDWSWLLIFALMTWNLAAVFGTAHPDWGLSLRWGMGALATVLLFASVLAHEIAHSLTARAFGIPVRSIGAIAGVARTSPSCGSHLDLARAHRRVTDRRSAGLSASR